MGVLFLRLEGGTSFLVWEGKVLIGGFEKNRMMGGPPHALSPSPHYEKPLYIYICIYIYIYICVCECVCVCVLNIKPDGNSLIL